MVLGSRVIACSAVTFFRPRIARRPSRPRSVPALVVFCDNSGTEAREG